MGHDPTRERGEEVSNILQAESGWVRRCSKSHGSLALGCESN